MTTSPASVRARWRSRSAGSVAARFRLEPDSRAYLVAASAENLGGADNVGWDREARYAATYALAREVVAKDAEPAPGAVEAALAARIADADPEIRATAIAGLARHAANRKLVVEAFRAPLTHALFDRDWRVAVDAVRALAGANGDDSGRDLVAGALPTHWTALAKGDALEAHVVIEAVRALAGSASRPAVATALVAVQQASADANSVAPISRGWIECLAAVALARAAPHPNVAELASRAAAYDRLPDHLRLPLLAELVTAGAGDISTRREAIQALARQRRCACAVPHSARSPPHGRTAAQPIIKRSSRRSSPRSARTIRSSRAMRSMPHPR